VNEEFFVVVSEKTVRLVSSVVFGAETPVNIWKDGLVFEAYYAEDTAAYSYLPLSRGCEVEHKGVYTLLVHFQLKSMVTFCFIQCNYWTLSCPFFRKSELL
jgi:hypothetical protein